MENRKKRIGKLFHGRKTQQKISHNLTIEHGVICNLDVIIPSETQRKLVIKIVYGVIHCGVPATHTKKKLEAWWPEYSQDVEKYTKRCKKCKELRNFTQTILHLWPREVESWNHVCMEHA